MTSDVSQSWDRELFERWYVVDGLSTPAIGARLDPPASGFLVQRALDGWGVPRRVSVDPAVAARRASITREDLQRIYVDEGHSIVDTARQLGVTQSLLRSRMSELGVPMRRGPWVRPNGRTPLSRDVLQKMLVDRRLSIPTAATELGYTRAQVASAMHRHGIVQPNPPKASLVNRLGAGELWWLHHHEQLSLKALGVRLSTSPQLVRQRFGEVGVELRTRARPSVVPERPVGIPEPDLELIEAALADAGQRYAEWNGTSPVLSSVSADDLRRLNHDERLDLDQIADRFGCSTATVYVHFKRMGVEYRWKDRRTGGIGWTPEQRRRLVALMERADVRTALGRLGLPLLDPGAPGHDSAALSQTVLEELYVAVGLSGADIGVLTGCSVVAVTNGLRRCGIGVRPALPGAGSTRGGGRHEALDEDTLRALAAQGLTSAEIATRVAIPSATTVKIAAQVLGIPLDGENAQQAVPDRVLSAVRAAQVGPDHASAVLDPRRNVGKVTWRAWPQPCDPVLLTYLLVTLELSLHEVARRLRISMEVLTNLVADLGIDIPQRQKSVRPRWRFDPEELRRLYVDDGWSQSAIAEHLGVSVGVVHRAVHRLHIPVAIRSGPPEGVPKRVLFDDLVADGRIRSALERHGIELAGVDPPTRREPLPDELVRELLVDIGVSPFQIELLTGRTGAQIRLDLGPGHEYLSGANGKRYRWTTSAVR